MKSDDRYSEEEVIALENIMGLQYGGDFFRRKMKLIASRSHRAEIGRALSGDLHLRLDEFGNPELVYNKQQVFIRFCADAVQFPAKLEYNAYGYRDHRQNMLKHALENYTQYKRESAQVLTPTNADALASDAGLYSHSSQFGFGRRSSNVLVGPYGHCSDSNKCAKCIKWKLTFEELTKDYAEMEKDWMKFMKTVNLSPDDDGVFTVPYYFEEGSSNHSILHDKIDVQWDKIRDARRWERKDD